jgi:hypothetical protein
MLAAMRRPSLVSRLAAVRRPGKRYDTAKPFASLTTKQALLASSNVYGGGKRCSNHLRVRSRASSKTTRAP